MLVLSRALEDQGWGLLSQTTFPCHYHGSMLLCVIETVVTLKAAWVNSLEKNFTKLQCLVAFSEVIVCLPSKSIVRRSICWGFLVVVVVNDDFLWGKGFRKFLWKKLFSFFCLFVCLFLFHPPGNWKGFLCEVAYPYFSLKLCYALSFHIFLMDFLLWKYYLFSPQFENKEMGIFGSSCCFVVVRKGNLEFWEYCGRIQKL